MKVKNWMKKNLVTVDPRTDITQILSLMQRHLIRHIPVVEKNNLVGLITDAEIRDYLYENRDFNAKAKDIMILNPVTINPSASIDRASQLIYQYSIGSLLVLERRKLVGIITRNDLLAAFMERFGVLRPGFRIDIMLENRADALEEVMRIIREHGGRVVGLGIEIQSSRRKIYQIRLDKGSWQEIVSAIEEAGHKVVSILEEE